MADLGLFIGALVVVYLVPGPDMVLILQTGATGGRGPAIATAAGLALARAAHVTLAALGLAALLTTSPMTFEVVRFAGATYLIWLGIQILRARSLLPEATATQTPSRAHSCGSCFYQGLLTNILNPKALLFCSVLLPQFVHAGPESMAGQFLLLGVILVSVGLAFDLVYASAGFVLGRWIARRPLVQTLQRWVFATMLIGFGLRLALSPRPF
ncbi:threonine/homoserine/homoserine lactone efflux protein [Gemmobacter caeni]|jgi:threonine/homoserine/homoserine lactone efflux protein|uniref:Threonine/homoserine/homoserine lactone efflux protein n=2 Tax=Alphaproteobacteria TaxID=28211 RepID=A0A840C2J5_9HYPH|nr:MULTISPECIES: LysE family translocator [Alphaproteobacteria]MBB4020081.1 threonine/homoserine/homoserine lactone efflux protein [Chelatococcus caeni]PTX52609.1 threonine/homoserine/homoserine lactone efflux protein [Gemmobacter caeni]TWI94934.1 threonine/homoserine/homoserine lactone efflux protein [Gemmobacter caeni]